MVNMNLYEQLYSLDKEITSLEKQIWIYFIENVDEKDKRGEVKLPLVNSCSLDANSSEYEKLRYYTSKIHLNISQTKQELKKIYYYADQIRSELIRAGLEEDKVEEETQRRINLLKNEFLTNIANLENKLKLINEDQKAYLRFRDFEESNFEMVKDKRVKNELKEMEKTLLRKKQERNIISKSIQSTFEIDEAKEIKEKNSKFPLCLSKLGEKRY